MRFRSRHLFAFVMAAGALLPTQAAAAADPVSVVRMGLDNPRGVATLGDLAIIAEAGHGNNTAQVSSVNTRAPDHHTIAGGLFSISSPEGETLGVSGVAVHNGKIYAIFGATPQQTGQAQAGKLVEVRQGSVRDIAGVGAWDYDETARIAHQYPDQEHDANPNAVLPTANGFLVADSGANTLTSVSKDGKKFAVRQYFPDRYSGFPSDEVPTCVARTDDALWVGSLAGNLWRLDEDGVTKVVPRDSTGKALLTHVTGCTAGGDNTLYLVNMFGPGVPFSDPSFFRGSVVQFKTDEGRASELANSVDSPALTFPYAAAIGRDGNLYVTAGALCDAVGHSPVPPGAPNPCVGGGKLVKIHLPSGNHEGGGDN